MTKAEAKELRRLAQQGGGVSVLALEDNTTPTEKKGMVVVRAGVVALCPVPEHVPPLGKPAEALVPREGER